MIKTAPFIASILALMLLAASGQALERRIKAENRETIQMASASMDLSKPINERFDSLRDYLHWQTGMHRRMADFPWYEEVRPGYFRFHRSRGQQRDDHEYSEDELRKKLGFRR